jgi:hypothetical protein
MNRTLELRSAQMPSSVDESQIREALKLTPGERIERHDAEYEAMRQLATEVQPQVAHARVA